MPESMFPLTIGRIYVVYGITTFRGHVRYYVLDDDQLPYPVWRLAPLFDLLDGRLPSSWRFGYFRLDSADVGVPIITFPEWANDHYFYERLVDGDPDAVATFAWRRTEAEG
ncbi:MAG TPA: hypothetical protein VGC11_06565 [Acidimicrobiia bacterium]